MKRLSTAEIFWKDTLELVIEGNGDTLLGVPSELFDIMELNDEHSQMPVWQRNELESDLRELSSFWGEERDLCASQVLINALSSTHVTKKGLDTICSVLSRCSVATPAGGVRITGEVRDVSREGAAEGAREDELRGGVIPEKEMIAVKPSEIYALLDGSIVSQQEAKRCASMIM